MILLGCLLASLSAVAVLEASDKRIRPNQLSAVLDIPSLARIPSMPSTMTTEFSDALTTMYPIIDRLISEGRYRFLITSAAPGEGRTTIADALRAHYERRGRRVDVLDATDEYDHRRQTPLQDNSDPKRLILIDSPALNVSGNALNHANAIDCAFLVVGSASTKRDIERSLATLETAKIPVVGLIINEHDNRASTKLEVRRSRRNYSAQSEAQPEAQS